MSTKYACNDKAIYKSKAEADAASLLAEHQYGVKLRSYKCKQCNLWHLASNF